MKRRALALVVGLSCTTVLSPSTPGQNEGGHWIRVRVLDPAGAARDFDAFGGSTEGRLRPLAGQPAADGTRLIRLGSATELARLTVRADGHEWTLAGLAADQTVVLRAPGVAESLRASRDALASGRLASSAGTRFRAVGAEAGVDSRVMTAGVLWGDFDDDGDPDLFGVGGHRDAFFGPEFPDLFLTNHGDGTFEDTTAAAGLTDVMLSRAAAAADIDGDGDLDVFVGNGEGSAISDPNNLYLNRGDATFEDVAGAAGVSLASDDANDVELFDFDRDGDVDVYFVSQRFDSNHLLRNRGDTTFADVTAEAGVGGRGLGRSATAFDLDSDGWSDLFVGNSSGVHPLYRNRGDGTFADVSGGSGVTGLTLNRSSRAADLNGDGWLDLVVVNQASASAFFVNERNGTFRNMAGTLGINRSGLCLPFGDVDADGFEDLLITNREALFRSRAGLGFEDVTESAGIPNVPWGEGAAFADYDADGDLDLYLGRTGSGTGFDLRNELFRNEGAGGSWIAVEPRGLLSNASALGARLEFRLGQRSCWRLITAGHSYASRNAHAAWVGLGTETEVAALVIHWPSGIVQERNRLPAARTLEVVESGLQLVEAEDLRRSLRVVGPPGALATVFAAKETGSFAGAPFGGDPLHGTLALDPDSLFRVAVLRIGPTGVELVPLSFRQALSRNLTFQALVGDGLTNTVAIGPRVPR